MKRIRKRPIEIDEIQFETVGEAARAYGKDRKFLYRYMKGNNKTSYTSKELNLDSITPQLNDAQKNRSTLTWEFVYRQLASSPKRRGVDSIHLPTAA
jgi:hypothetical protein